MINPIQSSDHETGETSEPAPGPLHYRRAYTTLFNAVTDALVMLENQKETPLYRTLFQAQLRAEEIATDDEGTTEVDQ